MQQFEPGQEVFFVWSSAPFDVEKCVYVGKVENDNTCHLNFKHGELIGAPASWVFGAQYEAVQCVQNLRDVEIERLKEKIVKLENLSWVSDDI